MAEQFENNYSTILNGAIDDNDTTITVDAAPVNMTGEFRIKIDDELIKVGTVNGLDFEDCERGAEGTTAASHSDNATVTHVLTAGALVDFSAASGGAAERKDWDVAANYPLHAEGDEFNYSNYTDFSAVWSLRNMDSSDFFFSGGNAVEVRTVAQGDYIYKSVPSGDFEVVMEISGGGQSGLGNMFGIYILDTSGVGIGYSPYDDTNHYMWNINAWVYSSTGNAGTGTPSAYTSADNRHHWILLKKSGTTYQGGVSYDGASITNRPTAQNSAGFTPAYLAIGRPYTTGGTHWRRIHRINIYTTEFTP